MTPNQKKTTVSTLTIQESVSRLTKQVNPLVKKLDGFTIVTKEDYEKAAEMVSKLKGFAKEADVQEKSITDPANTIIKNARSIFKPFKDLVSLTEATVKNGMLEFINKQEEKAKKLEKNFGDGKIKKLGTVLSKTNELRDTSSESAQVRKVYQLTIVDEKKIPREFLVPDEQAIKEALKVGKKVPGCKWEQVNQIAI